jgi:hypothetical protein
VPFQVFAEDGTREVNWLHGSYGAHAAIEVYVHAEALEQAEAVIGAELAHLTAELPFEAAEAGDCPACHHSLPDHARECPDCGLVFPDS